VPTVVLMLDEVQSALAVFVPPDDAEWLFSGTVARLTAHGARVDYVVCTDGANGGIERTVPAETITATTRMAELRAAADVLGVTEIVQLGYPDDQLEPTIELRRDLVRAIRTFKPQVVLAMTPTRVPDATMDILHGDHMASAEAALLASYPEARMPRIYPEQLDEGLAAHLVTDV